MHCYRLRHSNEDSVPVSNVIFSGTEAVTDSTIAGIARQHHRCRPDFRRPRPRDEAGFIIGDASITAHGVDVAERMRTASVNIRFQDANEAAMTAAAPHEGHESIAEPSRNKLLTFKLSFHGLSIDLEETFHRLSKWWQGRHGAPSGWKQP